VVARAPSLVPEACLTFSVEHLHAGEVSELRAPPRLLRALAAPPPCELPMHCATELNHHAVRFTASHGATPASSFHTPSGSARVKRPNRLRRPCCGLGRRLSLADHHQQLLLCPWR
jgi:hypothetical protein